MGRTANSGSHNDGAIGGEAIRPDRWRAGWRRVTHNVAIRAGNTVPGSLAAPEAEIGLGQRLQQLAHQLRILVLGKLSCRSFGKFPGRG